MKDVLQPLSDHTQAVSNGASAQEKNTGNGYQQLHSLIKAIVENRAVIYVGSGASIPSGFPSWPELLNHLYEEGAKKILANDPDGLPYLGGLIKEKKYLEAADLLQHCLGNDLLHELLSEYFDKPSAKPSKIHRHIARIPFTMAITTNYDGLLEQSYTGGEDKVLTWLSPDAVLFQMRHNKFFVLKTHGTLTHAPSLVLNARHYRDLAHKNPLFWQLEKWTFMTRTCLFVGASLSDTDLLQLLDEAKSASPFSSEHFALLPKEEAPDIRVQHMKDDLKVTIVPLSGSGQQWIELKTAEVLVYLSGEVAWQTIETRPPKLPTSDDPDFFLDDALQKLLDEAVKITGSFRGDICHSKDGIGSHLSGEIIYSCISGPTNHYWHKRKDVRADSVCGVAYYQKDDEGIIINNLHDPSELAKAVAGSPLRTQYKEAHSDVKSEMALAINADGVRVGVLNLESDLEGAYCKGHSKAARWFADKAGELFAAKQERSKRSLVLSNSLIKGIYEDLRVLFNDLMKIIVTQNPAAERDRSTPDTSLEFLVCRADYKTGELVSHDASSAILPGSDGPEKILPFKFKFKEDVSLVTKIFSKKSAILCIDSARGRDTTHEISTLSALKGLGVNGALLGFPIYVRGYVVGVMVAWRKDGEQGDLGWQHMELLRRVSHLMSNAPRRSGLDVEKKRTIGLDGSAEMDQLAININKDQLEIEKVKGRIQSIRHIIEAATAAIDPTQGQPGDLLLQAKISGNNICLHEEEEKDSLDGLLFEEWKDIAARMACFLGQLDKRYGKYRDPSFLVPTRSRLWIKHKSKEGHFGLVLQVRLDEEKNKNTDIIHARVKNLYDCRCGGEFKIVIVSQTPLKEEKKEEEKEHEFISRKEFCKATIKIDQEKPLYAHRSVSDDYLNFLMSRIGVDRFARQQRPLLLRHTWLGRSPDKNCAILEKDENAAWHVAPIQVIHNKPIEKDVKPIDKNKKPVPETVLEYEKEISGNRSFVAYMTFDVPKKPENESDPTNTDDIGQEPMLENKQQALQNELLHTLDVFTACCAELPEFHGLVDKEAPEKNIASSDKNPSS